MAAWLFRAAEINRGELMSERRKTTIGTTAAVAPQSASGSAAAEPRVADLVQAGKVRLALFLPQYTKDPATGELRGLGMGFVALEVVRALAARLGIEMLAIENPTPLKAVEGVKTGVCDVAFLGIDPSRSAEIDFTPPVVQFDFSYLVPAGSSINGVADADRPGIRIAVVRNHASTMTLSRLVKHAELVDAELPDAAFELLCAGHAQAFAAPREQLLDYAAKLPGSRVLEDSYGINRVAIAVAKSAPERLAYLSEFVEEAKTSGLVARIIERGGLRGFSVATAAGSDRQ
jgi:polar amino acid transport system substrate-binding protein